MGHTTARQPAGYAHLLYVPLVLRAAWRGFQAHDHLQTAATLAYYGFFALIPMFLLVVIVLSRLSLSSEAALEAVASFTRDFLPQFDEVVLREIRGLAAQRLWGWFSALALVWVMTPFAGAVRKAFARTFRMGHVRGVVRTKLRNLGAVLVLLSLFLVMVGGEVLLATARAGPLAGLSGRAGDLLHGAAGATATVVFLALFYRVFVPVRPTLAELAVGACVASALFFAVRPGFALVLTFNPNYGYAFGSLKTVFLVTMWMYVTSATLLFGAEAMAAMRRREALALQGLFEPDHRDDEWLTALRARWVAAYEPGAVICSEGEAAHEMFHILSGAVAVEKGGRTVRRFGQGSYVGEMAMILREPRSATIVAVEPATRVLRISEQNLQLLLEENPDIVKGLLREMALRLQATTVQIS